MAFCKACGTDIGAANFCPKCGANQNAAAPASRGPAAAADSPTAGIDENIAGLLCYLFHWLSGLIFLLIDKRPFVRFHGAQAIVFDVAVGVLAVVLGIVLAIFGWFALLVKLPVLTLLVFPLWGLFGVAAFGTWIFLMYKAYQGEKFKLPVIGNLVEGMIK